MQNGRHVHKELPTALRAYPEINESEPARNTGKVAPLAGTVHRGPAVPPAAQPASSAAVVPALLRNKQQQKQATVHEEEKAALVTAGIALGLASLWWYTRRSAI